MSPMWPFKPKKEIGEICTDFYASHVFRPEVTLKKGPVLWDGALQSIENVDYAISGVPREEFVREFNALRVELFGLAWAHQHDDAEYVLREVLFTRRYLEAIGRPDVWTAMAEYSSTVESASGQTGVGLQQREARLKRFEGEGVDPDSGQRAVNRLGTEASWQDGGTVEALATTFPERLGRPLRAQGAARLKEIIGELYLEAQASIKSVKVLTTWES